MYNVYIRIYVHIYVSKIIKIVLDNLCLHMLNFNIILNLLLLQQMMWEQQDLGCSRNNWTKLHLALSDCY